MTVSETPGWYAYAVGPYAAAWLSDWGYQRAQIAQIDPDSVTAFGYSTKGPPWNLLPQHGDWPPGMYPRPPVLLTGVDEPLRGELRGEVVPFGQIVIELMLLDRAEFNSQNPVKVVRLDPDTGEPFTLDKLVLVKRRSDMGMIDVVRDRSQDEAFLAISELEGDDLDAYNALYRKVVAKHVPQQIAGEGETR